MPSYSGFDIAKRSLSLSKTYVVISIGLSIFALGLANTWTLLSGLTTTGIPPTTNIELASTYPLISVPLMVFATLTFTTPVILLYVYDKNNGMLEYFLSLGMDQRDVYMSYLRAALVLAGAMLSYEIVANIGLSIITKAGQLLVIEETILALVVGLPVVSLVTIIMMAFSTMQKQRVGSNQPLGIGIGVLLVLPTYFVPFLPSSFVLPAELVIATIITVLSLTMFLLASTLIKREKMLP